MKVDRLYILCGFVWVVAAMVFGFYLGAAEQLQYSNTHAHAALVGFVLSILFGLIFRCSTATAGEQAGAGAVRSVPGRHRGAHSRQIQH